MAVTLSIGQNFVGNAMTFFKLLALTWLQNSAELHLNSNCIDPSKLHKMIATAVVSTNGYTTLGLDILNWSFGTLACSIVPAVGHSWAEHNEQQ